MACQVKNRQSPAFLSFPIGSIADLTAGSVFGESEASMFYAWGEKGKERKWPSQNQAM